MKVRVRIAPSPTGYPHIGTIWQALINYAFAKKQQGRFIVRIEDTDQKRLIPDAEKKLFQALDWFGFKPDESPVKPGRFGPYRQSERLDLYKKYAQDLVERGHAYYCFCSSQRLIEVRKKMAVQKKPPMYDGFCRKLFPQEIKEKIKAGKKYVVRLKVPKKKDIIVNDLLRGKVKFNSKTVDDQVLLKSDGYPTYHLAVVVDDHLMKISHMVRGEEWLSSAPKHVLIYQFLDWQEPVYVHTPILRNPDHSKLSKRQGHTAVSWYQENGYLPSAILNFLGLLGWSHPQEKTIFSLSEFTKFFDLKDLSPVGPVVDLKKLDYLNGVYIRSSSGKDLVQLIKPFLVKKKLKFKNEQLAKICPLIKQRIEKLTQAPNLISFFVKMAKYPAKLLFKKGGSEELVHHQLILTARVLTEIAWNLKNINQAVAKLCQENNWQKSQYFMMLRVAVTGRTITPPLMESMEILGKKLTLERIKDAVKLIK